jgi:hypothetical protein
VAPSSSAKKVAKLASRGKGKKVRFQGGSIFPIAVAIVVILGLLVIVYGRQSRPADGSGAPYINDGTNENAHWHVAFGIYVCDTFEPKLQGTKEETGVDANGNTIYLNDKFRILGIHSHGDGIIHYHPYSTKSSGNRAKLGVFLDVYDVKVTDSEIVMPADQGGGKWSNDDTKCDGKDTQLRARVWDHYDKPDDFHDVVTGFDDIRIKNDGMVIVLAFTPKGADIPMPDWAAQLPTLGASDVDNLTPTTTLPGASTTTVAGGSTTTTVAGATTTSAETSTSVASSTTAATTTTGG